MVEEMGVGLAACAEHGALRRTDDASVACDGLLKEMYYNTTIPRELGFSPESNLRTGMATDMAFYALVVVPVRSMVTPQMSCGISQEA